MTRNLLILLLTCAAFGQNDPNRKDSIQAFNRRNLDGWVAKITGYPLGENYANTFRVENGVLRSPIGVHRAAINPNRARPSSLSRKCR
jgi:hypothetical protein